jgi:hypothetical protein
LWIAFILQLLQLSKLLVQNFLPPSSPTPYCQVPHKHTHLHFAMKGKKRETDRQTDRKFSSSPNRSSPPRPPQTRHSWFSTPQSKQKKMM